MTLRVRIGGVCVALALASLGATVASALPGQTKANFDGTWSVVIVTEKGDCDRAYRYPISITNGSLANAGSASFDISGKVAPDGAITVRVSRGDRNATGMGRLSADSGTGSWKGGSCTGTWAAERR